MRPSVLASIAYSQFQKILQGFTKIATLLTVQAAPIVQFFLLQLADSAEFSDATCTSELIVTHTDNLTSYFWRQVGCGLVCYTALGI